MSEHLRETEADKTYYFIEHECSKLPASWQLSLLGELMSVSGEADGLEESFVEQFSDSVEYFASGLEVDDPEYKREDIDRQKRIVENFKTLPDRNKRLSAIMALAEAMWEDGVLNSTESGLIQDYVRQQIRYNMLTDASPV